MDDHDVIQLPAAFKPAPARTPAGIAHAGLDSLRWMLNNRENAGTEQFEALLKVALEDAADADRAIAELEADVASARFGEREWRMRARDMQRERDEALEHGLTLLSALRGYARRIRAIAEGVSGGS